MCAIITQILLRAIDLVTSLVFYSAVPCLASLSALGPVQVLKIYVLHILSTLIIF